MPPISSKKLYYVTASGDKVLVGTFGISLGAGNSISMTSPEYLKLTFSAAPSGDLLTWLEANAVKQANDTAVQTNKALTITSNGTTEITPDVPYDAMSKVTVTATIGATEPYREETLSNSGYITGVNLHGYSTIPAYAFYHSNIGSFDFPIGITGIHEYAFAQCQWLTSIAIPGSVSRVESYAFQLCTGLHTVTFEGTPQSISASMFDVCRQAFTINVPWAEGDVSGAPWGATNATINYNYTGG